MALNVSMIWIASSLAAGTLCGVLQGGWTARRTTARLTSGEFVKRIVGWRKWMPIAWGALMGIFAIAYFRAGDDPIGGVTPLFLLLAATGGLAMGSGGARLAVIRAFERLGSRRIVVTLSGKSVLDIDEVRWSTESVALPH